MGYVTDERLSFLLTQGGDERILIDPTTGLNRYNVRPVPDDCIAYSSSTANTISHAAFAHCRAFLERHGGEARFDYDQALDALRRQIRAIWGVDERTRIIFAASGTDLEFAGLAAAHRASEHGLDNILLGADEVGSGCIHSASGHYFARTTPMGVATEVGQPVGPDFVRVRRVDLPVRCDAGIALDSAGLTAAIIAAAEAALAHDRRPLIHVLHGSKTGLVLPELPELDQLIARFGERASYVVDACQVRISPVMVRAYLDRGCVVFLTGSKFAGGPPFNGFALVPEAAALAAAPLPAGFATLSASAEWPEDWPGRDSLPDAGNPGLALRLAASLFEMERFLAMPRADMLRIIAAFEAAVDGLARRLGGQRLPAAMAERRNGGIAVDEMRTLATLDLSGLRPGCDEAETRRIYNAMAMPGSGDPIRLGQPVKCVRLDDGRFGGTLRLGLSMPQMVAFAALDDAALAAKLEADMAAIGNRIAALAG